MVPSTEYQRYCDFHVPLQTRVLCIIDVILIIIKNRIVYKEL